ncbi:uncharacterized protein LOC110442799 [Mizuhopecten yessoensis]|uniref:NADH dehydrogenase [ubiquinone] 1 alpha subcomplex subunit 11 n=1 Tax=Mizuhopecten yessoensis TaxID=6573 RepID=A0A210PGE8_MIZYE|nr:uncharacterized protein LOC110442799 [Mizuhopecten yessoensis]OWF35555.1 NADH dehydrogenase [ubiquinone] 1 alpha subcomplex subunit 11 [Mizuhopecten yessoensis]
MEGEEKQSEDPNTLKEFISKRNWEKDWHIIWTVPDGERTEEKATTAVVYASAIGVTSGLFRASLGPTAATSLGLIPKLGVFGAVLGPNIVAAATFVYVTSYAAQVRGKSEAHNHAFGGAAAGAILGFKHKSLLKIAQRSIWLGVAGVLASQLTTLPGFQEIIKAPTGKQLYVLGGRRWKTPTNLEHK